MRPSATAERLAQLERERHELAYQLARMRVVHAETVADQRRQRRRIAAKIRRREAALSGAAQQLSLYRDLDDM